MTDSAAKYGMFRDTLVHEMAHSYSLRNMDIYQKWTDTFWVNGGKSLKTALQRLMVAQILRKTSLNPCESTGRMAIA